ncbi:hypothetical protein ACOYW6_01565 [Parablastomonas sp. CN1-191]|uniref:hypothetical protein n=1 Tax=Parablastomonas sp. CN1-191 TaxID=3400908 RepID=UPI003BF88854
MKAFVLAPSRQLGSLAAPHPFLARLPAHVRVPFEDKVAAIAWPDLRDFVLAYCACFLAVTTYFA